MKITIYRDGVWAGEGQVICGQIVDCPAVLGITQVDSDKTYEMIEDLMFCEGAIMRPDGVYSWEFVFNPSTVQD